MQYLTQTYHKIGRARPALDEEMPGGEDGRNTTLTTHPACPAALAS